MLGSIFAADPELRAKISIHTKCNNGQLPHKSLSKVLVRRTRRTRPAALMASVGGAQESVLYQAETSLSNLQTESIDLFYLHGPDIKTPIEETLEAIDELAKAGKIVEFGLSNFPAWKVVDIWHKCAAKDMVRPTVFQGWCAAWFEIALPQLR
eukprot:COSAG04_NODE_10329_length_786_cov_1.248908_2_plen_153_part_00